MLSPCNQEPSADAALQFQFTAYLQTALRRQQQRSQAKLDRMRFFECDQELSVAETEYFMPDDTITLELSRLPLREQKILLLHVLDKLKFSEIASMLRISECAAQKAYRRTVTLLRGRLEGA